MRITHFGHACVLLEDDRSRVLIDPGSFSSGLEDVADLAAVLITHGHVDHCAPDQLRRVLRASPGCTVTADASAADAVAAAGVDRMVVAEPGRQRAGGVEVDVVPGTHEPVHPDMAGSGNTAFVVGGRVLHPGDSLAALDRDVEVLLVPVAGPWMRLSQAIDLVRALRPRVAVPVHQGGLVPAHRELHRQALAALAPAGTQVLALEHGRPTDL